MTRHRFRITRFVILVIALAITNGATVSPNPVNTTHATATTANIASFIHIGIQPAYAEKCGKGETRWACTCNLYSDRHKLLRKGKAMGQWEGPVCSSAPRWLVEKVVANDVCENATKAVNCKQCGCSNPRR